MYRPLVYTTQTIIGLERSERIPARSKSIHDVKKNRIEKLIGYYIIGNQKQIFETITTDNRYILVVIAAAV